MGLPPRPLGDSCSRSPRGGQAHQVSSEPVQGLPGDWPLCPRPSVLRETQWLVPCVGPQPHTHTHTLKASLAPSTFTPEHKFLLPAASASCGCGSRRRSLLGGGP